MIGSGPTLQDSKVVEFFALGNIHPITKTGTETKPKYKLQSCRFFRYISLENERLEHNNGGLEDDIPC